MPVETAADRAVLLGDFGTSIAWTRGPTTVPLTGIFDNGYSLLTSDLVDAGVEGSSPQILCRTADLPAGASQGDAVVISDPDTTAVSSYTAVEIKPDGTGMTTVRLQEA